MVNTEAADDGPGKPSLKVKLGSKAGAVKQPADGAAKLKVKLPAIPPQPEALDLVESDISEEAKPKKQPAKRQKKQPQKQKRARTPDEVWPIFQLSCCMLITFPSHVMLAAAAEPSRPTQTAFRTAPQWCMPSSHTAG